MIYVLIAAVVVLLVTTVVLFRELRFSRAYMIWYAAWHLIARAVAQDARAAVTGPDHTKDDFSQYGTQAEQMRTLADEQEDARRAARKPVGHAIDALFKWEYLNPTPQPPTYFGRRIHVPFLYPEKALAKAKTDQREVWAQVDRKREEERFESEELSNLSFGREEQ